MIIQKYVKVFMTALYRWTCLDHIGDIADFADNNTTDSTYLKKKKHVE